MPSTGPSPRTSGAGSASSTVTSRPRTRHVAATSEPMNPAPTTTTRGPAVERGAERERVVERAQHEDARRGRACPAAVRGVAPGGEDEAVERRALVAAVEGSTRSAGADVERRPPARRAAGRGRARRSGGRRSASPVGFDLAGEQLLRERRAVVGRCGSAPTSTIRPSYPSRRSVSVARSPASEAPTTTTVRNADVLSGFSRPGRTSPTGPCTGRASTPVQGGGQGSMLRRSPAGGTGARSAGCRLRVTVTSRVSTP